jgi:ASCH domain
MTPSPPSGNANTQIEAKHEATDVYDGYALSLKQPWATLLAHGKKSIEIRRWPTAKRGRILIHASSVPDERAEAWMFVPQELRHAAQLNGGIVGLGELTECRAYRTLPEFARDQGRHLNHLSWFQGPVMYGFVFSNLSPLPFHACAGWMRFFSVAANPKKRKRAK